ncbi:ABC transporter permease [Meiothermus sp. QL-1]|uniref:ABC transporter permease n=1 Tax=Meiothermus sp. QL-1 TaxID=2058095 RepID=UPI000E09F76D|nr:ABC transporter permease [Meiothermus sp. QL-1]RDI95984.1 ABC transporter permease [Meiothermus sp. QL-1]
MLRYLVSRGLQALLLMAGALVLVFFLVRLTGDPLALMLPKEADAEQRAAFRAAMGLDQPLWLQFAQYLRGVLEGDLGHSLRNQRPNLELILERLPATLELALAAFAFILLVALPLGLLAGLNPGGLLDRLALGLAFAAQVVPSFWLAMLLILWFAVELGWFPSFGRDSPLSLVLPAVALGFSGLGQMLRLVRTAALEARRADYLRTARAKGLSPARITWHHLLPNLAIPIVSVASLQLTYLLGGSIYIETIFAWPGLGSLLNTAIQDADFPLVQAITLFIAFFVILLQLLADLAYAWLDPRIQHS